MATELDELHYIEAQIEEAISLHQQSLEEPYGRSARHEAIHIGLVLRVGLVRCQLLRRRIEDRYKAYENEGERLDWTPEQWAEHEPFSDGDDYHCMNCGESFDYWEVRGPSTLKQVGLRCPMCENTEMLGPKRGDGDGD